MTKPRYKAFVCLTKPLNLPDGSSAVPALQTKSFLEKKPVLDFVRALYDQGLICSYRMLYSPNGEEDNYYNDEEVVYLDNARVVSIIS